MGAIDLRARTVGAAPAARAGAPGYDWLVAALSVLVVAGGYLAGWAANHRGAADSLLSPWRVALDAGFLLVAAALLAPALRRHRRGAPWRAAAPAGYGLGLAGLLLALVGLALTPAWQVLFGAASGLAGVVAPPLLLTAAGVAMIAACPLIAGWRRVPPGAGTWSALGPGLLAATALLAALTFATQFAHPLVRADAAVGAATAAAPQEVYAVGADGAGQRRLTVLPPFDDFGPSWSPDGRRIVFSRGHPAELWAMAADGGGPAPLTHLGRNSYLAHWSPDGARLVFISQVGDDVGSAAVYSAGADGGDARPLTHSGKREYGAVWSPDGRRIAFGSLRDGTWQVYLMDADGANQRRISGPGGGNKPTWSPDGRRLAFTSDRTGRDQLYLMDADGGNERRLTDDADWDDHAAWSPDGSAIAFQKWRGGDTDLYVMDADGRNGRDVSNSPATEDTFPAWSPDGRTLAYTAKPHAQGPPADLSQALGLAGIAWQAALLMGLALPLARRWSLPFGALTLLIGGDGLLLGTLGDRPALALSAVAGGLIADLLLRTLRPSAGAPGRLAGFAFVAPVVVYGCYFLAVRLTGGLAWPVNVWAGALLLAGAAGLLVGALVAAASPGGAAPARQGPGAG